MEEKERPKWDNVVGDSFSMMTTIQTWRTRWSSRSRSRGLAASGREESCAKILGLERARPGQGTERTPEELTHRRWGKVARCEVAGQSRCQIMPRASWVMAEYQNCFGKATESRWMVLIKRTTVLSTVFKSRFDCVVENSLEDRRRSREDTQEGSRIIQMRLDGDLTHVERTETNMGE